MRGIIYTALADMVESKYGLDVWHKMLDDCELQHGGSYTAGGDYSDKELFCLVEKLCTLLDIPQNVALRAFGHYLIGSLLSEHRGYIEKHDNLKSFLMSIDNVIHVDVEKLYPGASTPFLRYIDRDEDKLTIFYSSSRKLCFLAEGLIYGAAEYFNCAIQLDHVNCMHDGDDYCRFEIVFHG